MKLVILYLRIVFKNIFHSRQLQLQMTFDPNGKKVSGADCRFLYMDVTAYGKQSNEGIFSVSSLQTKKIFQVKI